MIQRQVFDRLSGAIYVLNELTHGNLSAEAKSKKSIFASDTDEIGQLISAVGLQKKPARVRRRKRNRETAATRTREINNRQDADTRRSVRG